MDLDRNTIKAVSAETRLKMLKMLTQRKKMPSELSKEIGLAPSTIVEHLQTLETAGLIRRVETGHKWIYYELTDKGVNIVQPRMPVQFMLTLAVGILMISFGLLKYVSSGIMGEGVQKSAASEAMRTTISGASDSVPASAINETVSNTVQNLPYDWLYPAIIVVGVIIIIFSIYKLMKKGRTSI